MSRGAIGPKAGRVTEPFQIAAAFFAGILGGGISAVAGGGTLISFPMLAASTGLSSKVAAATNGISLWPGNIGGGVAGFLGFKDVWPRYRLLAAPTILGSTAGAFLLKVTPTGVFDVIVPFLILFAVGLLAGQKPIKAWAAASGRRISTPQLAAIQFCLSIYGGYFGAGVGMMMLAVFGLSEKGELHEHNSLKNWLAATMSLSIIWVFVSQHMVAGMDALPMMLGALIGGYVCVRLIQKVEADKVRIGIVVFGLVAIAYFVAKLFV